MKRIAPNFPQRTRHRQLFNSAVRKLVFQAFQSRREQYFPQVLAVPEQVVSQLPQGGRHRNALDAAVLKNTGITIISKRLQALIQFHLFQCFAVCECSVSDPPQIGWSQKLLDSGAVKAPVPDHLESAVTCESHFPELCALVEGVVLYLRDAGRNDYLLYPALLEGTAAYPFQLTVLRENDRSELPAVAERLHAYFTDACRDGYDLDSAPPVLQVFHALNSVWNDFLAYFLVAERNTARGTFLVNAFHGLWNFHIRAPDSAAILEVDCPEALAARKCALIRARKRLRKHHLFHPGARKAEPSDALEPPRQPDTSEVLAVRECPALQLL